MLTLSEQAIADLLAPYLGSGADKTGLPADIAPKLATYLDLLLRWNTRTNLTAVRDPEEMVKRHFGESLCAGLYTRAYLPAQARVLDFGSGAGFPGIPVQLLQPAYHVTLAESQGKKAAFLREAVRTLGIGSSVWAGRVEDMPREERFDAVMLRAVDRMGAMVEVAKRRLMAGGVLVELTGEGSGGTEVLPIPARSGSFVRITRAE